MFLIGIMLNGGRGRNIWGYTMKIKGLDKLQKELKKIKNNAEKLSKQEGVAFSELFNSSFMAKYTTFSTIDELFEKGGFVINSSEDFENIPQEQLDQHVAKTTSFSSWEEMMSKAGELYVAKQLGF